MSESTAETVMKEVFPDLEELDPSFVAAYYNGQECMEGMGEVWYGIVRCKVKQWDFYVVYRVDPDYIDQQKVIDSEGGAREYAKTYSDIHPDTKNI